MVIPNPAGVMPLVHRVVGALSLHPRGYGFVATLSSGPDVFVPPTLLCGSGPRSGDLVSVRVEPSRDRPAAAEILWTRRVRSQVFGVVHRGKLIPDPYVMVGHPVIDGPAPPDGTAVIALILDDGRVRVVRDLGDPASPRTTAIQALERLNLGILLAAHPGDDSAVEDVCPCPRVDLTHLPAIAIDRVGTRDVDDALSAEALPGGATRLYLHTADAALFVPPGGPVDRRASALGATAYLPGLVVSMLPPSVATCASLTLDEDRPAVSVSLDIDATGSVTRRDVQLSVVRLSARTDYATAERVLLHHTELPGDAGNVLRRADRALFRLDQFGPNPETGRQFRIDPPAGEDVPLARSLIRQAIRVANAVIGEWLADRNLATISRTHPALLESVGPALEQYAIRRGYEADLDGVPAAAVPLVAESLVRHGASRTEIAALLARHTAPARYVLPAEGRQPVHATSPLRRYADLAVQRTIHQGMCDAAPAAPYGDEALVAQLNEADTRIAHVARLAAQLALARQIERNPRWTAPAQVVRVSERGAQVRLATGVLHWVRPSARTQGLHEGERVRVRARSADGLSGDISLEIMRPSDQSAPTQRRLTPAVQSAR